MTSDQAVVMSAMGFVPARTAAPARTGLVIGIIFVVALLPLLSTPVLPLIDLYNHLARYFVLAHLDTIPLLRRYYEVHWAILPNIGLDVIGTELLRVLPAVYAAHVTVIGVFAVQFGGVLMFNRAVTGRWSMLVALLLVPLLYSYILNWGFANFLLGLGLVFAAAAWWIARRDRPWLAVPVACILAVAVFFTHGLDFALYGILVGSLEVGFFINAPDRDWRRFARQLGLLAVQAIVPVWLFTLAPITKASGGMTNADTAVVRLSASGGLGQRLWELAQHRIETIVRVAEGPTYLFDFVVTGLMLALLVVLVRQGALRIARLVWPVLAAAAVLVVMMPPALFGIGYVADRMPLFFALALVGGLVVELGHYRDRMIGIALTALVAARLVAITADWSVYAADYRDFTSVAVRVEPGALVADFIVAGNRHDNASRRCQMYRPLLVSRLGAISPLFASAGAQPLRLVGPLRRAADAMPILPDLTRMPASYFGKVVAAAGPAGYDYLLVCDVARSSWSVAPGAPIVAQQGRFTLLHVRQSLPNRVE